MKRYSKIIIWSFPHFFQTRHYKSLSACDNVKQVIFNRHIYRNLTLLYGPLPRMCRTQWGNQDWSGTNGSCCRCCDTGRHQQWRIRRNAGLGQLLQGCRRAKWPNRIATGSFSHRLEWESCSVAPSWRWSRQGRTIPSDSWPTTFATSPLWRRPAQLDAAMGITRTTARWAPERRSSSILTGPCGTCGWRTTHRGLDKCRTFFRIKLVFW